MDMDIGATREVGQSSISQGSSSSRSSLHVNVNTKDGNSHTVVKNEDDADLVVTLDEFKWNLKRVLREGYPDGIYLHDIEDTYYHWFGKVVRPDMFKILNIINPNSTNASSTDICFFNWAAVFVEHLALRQTFILKTVETDIFKVKLRPGSTKPEEMKLILALTEYARYMAYQRDQFNPKSNVKIETPETVQHVIPISAPIMDDKPKSVPIIVIQKLQENSQDVTMVVAPETESPQGGEEPDPMFVDQISSATFSAVEEVPKPPSGNPDSDIFDHSLASEGSHKPSLPVVIAMTAHGLPNLDQLQKKQMTENQCVNEKRESLYLELRNTKTNADICTQPTVCLSDQQNFSESICLKEDNFPKDLTTNLNASATATIIGNTTLTETEFNNNQKIAAIVHHNKPVEAKENAGQLNLFANINLKKDNFPKNVVKNLDTNANPTTTTKIRNSTQTKCNNSVQKIVAIVHHNQTVETKGNGGQQNFFVNSNLKEQASFSKDLSNNLDTDTNATATTTIGNSTLTQTKCNNNVEKVAAAIVHDEKTVETKGNVRQQNLLENIHFEEDNLLKDVVQNLDGNPTTTTIISNTTRTQSNNSVQKIAAIVHHKQTVATKAIKTISFKDTIRSRVVKSTAKNKNNHCCSYLGCHESFDSVRSRQKHIIEIHLLKGLKYPCPLDGCKNIFSRKEDMLQHSSSCTSQRKRRIEMERMAQDEANKGNSFGEVEIVDIEDEENRSSAVSLCKRKRISYPTKCSRQGCEEILHNLGALNLHLLQDHYNPPGKNNLEHRFH